MVQPSTDKMLLYSIFIQDQKLRVTRTQETKFKTKRQEDEKLSEIASVLETNILIKVCQD